MIVVGKNGQGWERPALFVEATQATKPAQDRGERTQARLGRSDEPRDPIEYIKKARSCPCGKGGGACGRKWYREVWNFEDIRFWEL